MIIAARLSAGSRTGSHSPTPAASRAAPRRAGSSGCRARSSASTGPTARTRWRRGPRRVPRLDGRDDAGGDADHERDRHRQHRELDRHRQLLDDQVEHRLLRPHRLAKIAAQRRRRPSAVAHRQRLVEVELFAQVGDDFWSRSSPARITAGSPGSSCCSPKISIETKTSVGSDRRDALDRNSIIGLAGSSEATPRAGGRWRFAAAVTGHPPAALPVARNHSQRASNTSVPLRKGVAGRRAQRLCGAEERRARGLRAQRATPSDLPLVFERRERSERSELCGRPRDRAPQGSRAAGPTAAVEAKHAARPRLCVPAKPIAHHGANFNPTPAAARRERCASRSASRCAPTASCGGRGRRSADP